MKITEIKDLIENCIELQERVLVCSKLSKEEQNNLKAFLFNNAEVIINELDSDIFKLEDGEVTLMYSEDKNQLSFFEKRVDKIKISQNFPIAILNTTILTASGEYRLRDASLDEVKSLIDGEKILSAVGHESTSQILTDLLGVDVPVNRIQFEQGIGQVAVCFKLKGRPEEGKILSLKEIEDIGYDFKILKRLS